MSYDYSKLRGRIAERFGKRLSFASAMGISARSLSLKMNGKVSFKQPEIAKACKLLDIADADIGVYFFTPKVQ